MADDQGRKVGLGPPSVLVARSVGIVCIASGFVAGIEGLSRPDSVWLPTAFALILTGLVAQGYAFYQTVRNLRRRAPRSDRDDGKTGDDQGR